MILQGKNNNNNNKKTNPQNLASPPGDREAWRMLSKGEHFRVELAKATVFAAGEQIKAV